MRPIFLLSVPGSGTLFTMRQLMDLGYQASPHGVINLEPGVFSQLHTLSDGDEEIGREENYFHVPTVIPMRDPRDVLVTMLSRDISPARAVLHFHRLIEIYDSFDDLIMLDVNDAMFVNYLAQFCDMPAPPAEAQDLSPENVTQDKMKKGEVDLSLVDFAVEWFNEVYEF